MKPVNVGKLWERGQSSFPAESQVFAVRRMNMGELGEAEGEGMQGWGLIPICACAFL